MSLKIGILGGTFDPPHIGHLWIVQQVLEVYKLDYIWFMPCYTGSGYAKYIKTSCADRARMCTDTVVDFRDPRIQTIGLEIEKKIKYTYQTVKYLKGYFGKTPRIVYLEGKEVCYKNAKFSLIIGSDWDIESFKNCEEVKTFFKIIRVNRPGSPGLDPVKLPISFCLSSSLVRERVSNGLSIRGLVTPTVEQYIKRKKLYVRN